MNLIKSRGFFGSSVTAKQETFKPFLSSLRRKLGSSLIRSGCPFKAFTSVPRKRKVSQLSILLSQRKRRMKADGPIKFHIKPLKFTFTWGENMKYIWCKYYLSCIRISPWKSLATLLTCSISVKFKTYKGYPPKRV